MLVNNISAQCYSSANSETSDKKTSNCFYYLLKFPQKLRDFDSNELWFKLKDCLVPPTKLGKSLRDIANDNVYNVSVKETLVVAFQSKEYPQLSFFISKIFRRLSDKQLDEVLKSLFAEYGIKHPQELVGKLKSFFTLQKIEMLVRVEFPQFQSVDRVIENIKSTDSGEREQKKIEEQKNLQRMAKHYLNSACEFFFNMITYILHLKEFLGEENYYVSDAYLADRKYMAFRENLRLFDGWLFALGVYTGSIVLGGFITSSMVVAGCVAAYVYYKFLKPSPDHLPPFKNLTIQAMKDKLAPVHGRDNEIQALIDALCSNNATTRRHPILLGQTRVGKTEIIKGLAQRIAAGTVPEVLKGKKLFSVNSADLMSYGALERVQNAVQGYESDCIFFFDEIHVAFKTSDNRKLVDKFKTLMDPSSDSFKYCIFATTQIEFEKYFGEDAAMLARLTQFNIDPLDQDQVPQVISEMVEREAGDLVVRQEAIDEVASIQTHHSGVFANHSQPATSKLILSQAIARARNYKPLEKEKELRSLRNQKIAIKYRNCFKEGKDHLTFSVQGIQRQKEFEQINAKIKQLETEVALIKNEAEMFFRLVKECNRLKTSLETEAPTLTNLRFEDFRKDFLLKYYYLQMALDEAVKSYSKKFPEAVVSKELVQKIILEEAVKDAHSKKILPVKLKDSKPEKS